MKLLIAALVVLLLTPLFPAASLSPVEAVEHQIAGLDHEVAIIFDSRNREIARFQGTRTYTIVVPSNRWYNGILTHNHPALPSLSPSDISMGKYGLKEIRAVSVVMGYQVCRAWRIGSTWPRLDANALNAQLKAQLDYHDLPTQEVIARAFISNLARERHFGYECHHE